MEQKFTGKVLLAILRLSVSQVEGGWSKRYWKYKVYCGKRKSNHDDKLVSNANSSTRDILCSEEECQQSEGNCEVDKTDDYDKLEVNIETLMPKQVNVMNTNKYK
ncbi:unnamed protein product [Brugia pahangi]|uniref:Uncharacterized protein n=1 Tax=Brugia pahangi TaxID=6280 RepID=A0A0N4T702_BRUPA|nr:unnamed protein product [Brugia pahangi]